MSCIIISKIEKQTLNVEVHTKYCVLFKRLMSNFIYVDSEFPYAQWTGGWVVAVPSTCALVMEVQVWMAGLLGASASRLYKLMLYASKELKAA